MHFKSGKVFFRASKRTLLAGGSGRGGDAFSRPSKTHFAGRRWEGRGGKWAALSRPPKTHLICWQARVWGRNGGGGGQAECILRAGRFSSGLPNGDAFSRPSKMHFAGSGKEGRGLAGRERRNAFGLYAGRGGCRSPGLSQAGMGEAECGFHASKTHLASRRGKAEDCVFQALPIVFSNKGKRSFSTGFGRKDCAITVGGGGGYNYVLGFGVCNNRGGGVY